MTAEKTVDQDTAKKEPEEKQSSEETEKKLSDLQKKYDELEDKYLRAEAEMQNMTKRFKRTAAAAQIWRTRPYSRDFAGHRQLESSFADRRQGERFRTA